jgi:hypothetical protein
MAQDWFEFIKRNNARIIGGFKDIQPRYYHKQENPPPNNAGKQEEPDKDVLDGESCLLLYLAFLEYSSPSSILQKKLGWGGEKFKRICNGLINKSFIADISINLSGKKGGLAKYLVLTAKGLKAIKVTGYIPNARGGTDTLHTWFQKNIGDMLESMNYKVVFEVNNGDTVIDIVASDKSKKYAIEVVCSTEKTEPAKYSRIDRSGDFGKVIFVCMSKTQAESIKKQLEGIAGNTKWATVIISEILHMHIMKEAENG